MALERGLTSNMGAARESPLPQNHAATSALLELWKVRKEFVRRGKKGLERTPVLDDVTFSAHEGDFVTIIGPSGCGKSTLLYAIAGLTGIDSGSMRLQGREIGGPGYDRAMVFQSASLLPWRTIERNIGYGLELRGDLSPEERAERVRDVIHLVGLSGFEGHYPHELSGGMQQRANLARALAVEPKLLLMDEPFGALDALTKEVLQDELSDLVGTSRRTTLFVTHDIAEAVFLGDKVLVISPRPGRIERSIEIPMPRPRSRGSIEAELTELVRELRSHLRHSMHVEEEPT